MGTICPYIMIARWKVLKNRLIAEGNETVTICHQLKMPASDGKMRMTDVLSAKWGTICTPVAMLCQDE